MKTQTLSRFLFTRRRWLLAAAALLLLGAPAAQAQDAKLLNVSYDPTRELYKNYNELFLKQWNAKNPGKKLTIDQSHAGSGKQARSVIEGVPADVVTLALAYDIDSIADKKLLAEDWQKRLPDNSSPYTSTIDFLVKKGNPKGIKDWDDLIKPGVQVITPDPRTSGGARWNYLAAWAFAKKKFNGDEANTLEFIKALFANVPVLDSGARGATQTFVQRGIGDVLINWENESHLMLKEKPGEYEIVTPSLSILAEPPVAVVDTVAAKNGTTEIAKNYLEYLYSPEAQELAATWFYRPRDKKVLSKYEANGQFTKVDLVTIDDAQFGGWRKAQKTHFEDGGTFSQIYKK